MKPKTQTHSVHYPLIVISDQKPTNEHLAKLLEPFAPCPVKDDPVKFDEWVLGGRYRGWLNVIDRKQALFSEEVTDWDKMFERLGKKIGIAIRKPGITNFSGYDAAQCRNLVPDNPIHWAKTLPRAVLIDGQWHELSTEAMMLSVFDYPPAALERIEREIQDWKDRFADLMDSVKPEQWISVIDCHV